MSTHRSLFPIRRRFYPHLHTNTYPNSHSVPSYDLPPTFTFDWNEYLCSNDNHINKDRWRKEVEWLKETLSISSNSSLRCDLTSVVHRYTDNHLCYPSPGWVKSETHCSTGGTEVDTRLVGHVDTLLQILTPDWEVDGVRNVSQLIFVTSVPFSSMDGSELDPILISDPGQVRTRRTF